MQDYKLQRKLVTAVVNLKIENETHVPDLMTRITNSSGYCRCWSKR